MAATPPLSAITDARRRQQDSLADSSPGTVTIAGTDYAAQVSVTPGELLSGDGGTRDAEQLTVRLSKTLLTTAPARKTQITYNEVAWTIRNVSGQESWAQEWVIRAQRSL